jgi:peptidoglycan hydrolase-like protein with peptidoglycan-binding domain
LLKLGDEGTAVERLQQRLGALGFYSGEIDGIFGEGTEDSVRQFQEQFDLEIDGIVGRSTWETLFN